MQQSRYSRREKISLEKIETKIKNQTEINQYWNVSYVTKKDILKEIMLTGERTSKEMRTEDIDLMTENTSIEIEIIKEKIEEEEENMWLRAYW